MEKKRILIFVFSISKNFVLAEKRTKFFKIEKTKIKILFFKSNNKYASQNKIKNILLSK